MIDPVLYTPLNRVHTPLSPYYYACLQVIQAGFQSRAINPGKKKFDNCHKRLSDYE